MTDIEQKALALVNEQFTSSGYEVYNLSEATSHDLLWALFRAIEQHEAFRQEVSDAVERWNIEYLLGDALRADMARFIIAKPDPLVEAYNEALPETAAVHGKETVQHICAKISAAIEKRGGKIIFNKE